MTGGETLVWAYCRAGGSQFRRRPPLITPPIGEILRQFTPSLDVISLFLC